MNTKKILIPVTLLITSTLIHALEQDEYLIPSIEDSNYCLIAKRSKSDLKTSEKKTQRPKNNSENNAEKITTLQAFYAMRLFLEKYYEETGSDDVGSLLGDLQFFEREKETADPAAWGDWMECVNKVLSEKGKEFEPDKLY